MLGGAVFSQFFLLTLYMQEVLHYSALKTGVAYIALTLTIIVFSGVAQALVTRVGVRWVLTARDGALDCRARLFAQLPVHGHYFSDLFPAFIIGGVGLALAFVPMSIGALTGVHPADAGVASGLLNTTQQIGGAIGVAIATTVATTFTAHYSTATPARAHSAAPRSRTASRSRSTSSPASPPPARSSPRSCSSRRPRNTPRPSRSPTTAHPRYNPQRNSARHEAARVDAFTQLVRAAARTTVGPGGPRGVAAATGLPVVERTSQSARHRAGCPARSQARRGRRRRASTNACFERARGRASLEKARGLQRQRRPVTLLSNESGRVSRLACATGRA